MSRYVRDAATGSSTGGGDGRLSFPNNNFMGSTRASTGLGGCGFSTGGSGFGESALSLLDISLSFTVLSTSIGGWGSEYEEVLHKDF